MFRTLILTAALVTAVPLAAQTGPCPGQMATIRVNTIKPGKDAVAAQAVADHQAWYAKRKLPTTVERAVVLKSGGRGVMVADAGKLMTITRYRGTTDRPNNDPEWNAFVAKYRDSTTQMSEVRACLK